MARFDAQLQTALRLIEKNGETAALRRKVDGALPDPAKPWEPGAPGFTQFSVPAVFLDEATSRRLGLLTKEGEQLALIPGVSLGSVIPDPATDHLVRASGEAWTVVRSEPLRPNGQLILHQVTVRK